MILSQLEWISLGTLRSELRLEKTLNGGQCFRWISIGYDTWAGVLDHDLVCLRETGIYNGCQ